METEIVLESFLADLGFVTVDARERALRALVEAGLTNGHKSRMAAWKLDSAREALDAALLCVCSDEDCLFLARWRAGDRELIPVEAIHCAICGGDPARRVISPARPPVGDELLMTVSHLLADRPAGQRIRAIERDLEKLGLIVTQRSLREMAAENAHLFERRGDILVRLVDPTVAGVLPEPEEITFPTADPETLEPAETIVTADVSASPGTADDAESVAIVDQEPGSPEGITPDETEPENEPALVSADIEGGPPLAEEPARVGSEPAVPAETVIPETSGWIDSDEEKQRFGGFMLALIRIEGELKRRSGDVEGRSGGVLLDFATERDALVASRAGDIRRLLRVRNVLVHEGIGGLPLVSPRPELIARAVEIGRWLSQRGRAVDYTEEPVLIEAEEPLSAAGRRLQARGQRMAIVREDGAIYGLLSESDLLTWTLGVLAGERERDETVGEFVDLEQDPRIHFFPSTAELGEVVGALRTAAFEKRAAVCLIGGAGGARERIRGIATLADLPRLEALLSAD